MALSKTTKIDRIELVGDFKIIQVRTLVEIKDGEEIIGSSFVRDSYCPDQEIANLPTEIQPYANTAWTADIISSYNEHILQ